METIVPGWDWRAMNGVLRQAQDERGIKGDSESTSIVRITHGSP